MDSWQLVGLFQDMYFFSDIEAEVLPFPLPFHCQPFLDLPPPCLDLPPPSQVVEAVGMR